MESMKIPLKRGLDMVLGNLLKLALLEGMDDIFLRSLLNPTSL